VEEKPLALLERERENPTDEEKVMRANSVKLCSESIEEGKKLR
jgi:hypothetical protein